MIIQIEDDFDLQKIIDSGQCFRPVFCQNLNKYRFIYRKEVLYIQKISGNRYEVSCDTEKWNNIWKKYFDIDRNYNSIRQMIIGDSYLNKAALFSEGIRILRQDEWEMLISFIISQRKSIPAIRSSIEKLCTNFGEMICTEYEKVYLFPKPEALLKADENMLAQCGLGYRLLYVVDAARSVALGNLICDELHDLDDDNLFDALCELKGVGTKVANCVMLFGYGRTGRAPVDVWIKKVIDEQYGGVNPFEIYGDYAGIVQQFLFYYRRNE